MRLLWLERFHGDRSSARNHGLAALKDKPEGLLRKDCEVVNIRRCYNGRRLGDVPGEVVADIH